MKDQNQIPQGDLWCSSHLCCLPPLKTHVKLNTSAWHYSSLLLFESCICRAAESYSWVCSTDLYITLDQTLETGKDGADVAMALLHKYNSIAPGQEKKEQELASSAGGQLI